MCGIAGLLAPAGTRDDAALLRLSRSMAERLRHRGPDDSNEWVDAAAGIGFGHRRLSIIDLSAAGKQPMPSASGRFVLNYNGEIYNFAELRRTLESRGVRFRGGSDTEVLVEAVAAWGVEETLRQANGMFALAVWDREARVLWLARDRLGQKPLYCGWANDAFVFASELKAFDGLPGIRRSLDRDALALFLRHAYVPEPWSIWKEFRKLPPGHLLKVTAQHVSMRRLPQPSVYWSIREAAEAGAVAPLTSEAEAEEMLDGLLGDAVRHCMVADVSLGVFLSGGIDSSLVAAAAQSQSKRSIGTFSIGFRDDRYDEARHGRAVARHLGSDHTELYVDDADARAIIPLLSSIYDEPFADSSQIPTCLVSKLARQSVTVALSGDGGDELFAGYNRYAWGASLARGIGAVPRILRAAGSRAVQAIPTKAWEAAGALLPAQMRLPQAGDKLHKLALALQSASTEVAYLQLTSLWPEPDAVVRGGREPSTVMNDPARWPAVGGFTEKMMLLDAESYLPGDILTKVDRASMAVSLEVRAPLLDHRLVEFAWRLPLSMKLRNNESKWLLRRVLDRYVPRALVTRPKMGFSVPIDSWLRGPLRDWAESLLSETRLRQDGYFEPTIVRQAWADHLSGRRNAQYALWAVLMFQAWTERQDKAA